MQPYFIVKALLFTFVLVLATVMFWQRCRELFAYLQLAKPSDRLGDWGRRVGSLIRYAFLQARVLSKWDGFVHALIFWGFLILMLAKLDSMVHTYTLYRFWALFGEVPEKIFLLLENLACTWVLVMILWAAVRRLLRPRRLKPSRDAKLILSFILLIVVTELFMVAFDHYDVKAVYLGPVNVIPVSSLLIPLLDGLGGQPTRALVGELFFWTHWGVILSFLVLIPRSKHLHLLGAMPNVFFKRFTARSALPKMDFEALEAAGAESFGVSKAEEFPWKTILDTYACTQCGWCNEYCPANLTGKPLAPREALHGILDDMDARGKVILATRRAELQRLAQEKPELPLAEREQQALATAKAKADEVAKPLLGETEEAGWITHEVLWSCTMCGACEAHCPELIEHVSAWIELRRYLVLTESSFAPELATTFRNLENNSNPWGISSSYRADWAEGLEVPTFDAAAHEYLFFVGCAGCTDDRDKRVSRALVEVLRAAGVSFGILGTEERCCGDPARRPGNEYLYQSLATENIELFQGKKVQKIVTACPHCFNTLAHEYPQLGGQFQVIHHSQLIAELLAGGRLKLDGGGPARRVSYHDSCYLGRWNDIYDAPREVVTALPGVTLHEPAGTNRKKGFCCGAGGGRMWLDEKIGKRVNLERTDQLLATGADTFAVACPFCMTMLSDGVKDRAKEEQIKVLDLAELVAGALPKKPAAPEAPPPA